MGSKIINFLKKVPDNKFRNKNAYITLGIIIFIIYGSVANMLTVKPVDANKNSNTSNTPTATTTAKPTSRVTSTPKPTEKPAPKINISGKIDPTLAELGEKVVMTFTIENIDESQTIEGMRIIFSESKFVQEDLAVVNVMAGGIQDGRAFEWKNDLMKIGPKEKKNFVIVTNAIKRGSFQSIVTFNSPYGLSKFDDQDMQLNVKLTVI